MRGGQEFCFKFRGQWIFWITFKPQGDVINTILAQRSQMRPKGQTEGWIQENQEILVFHSPQNTLKRCWMAFLLQTRIRKERADSVNFFWADSTWSHKYLLRGPVGQALGVQKRLGRFGESGVQGEGMVQGSPQKLEKHTWRSPVERNLRTKQVFKFHCSDRVIQL